MSGKTCSLRLYSKGVGQETLLELLRQVKDQRHIPFEIVDLSKNGGYDPVKEKAAYERDFKPRAKALKSATGRSITKLRSAKAGNYFVSTPETVGLLKDGQLAWWCHTETEIRGLLGDILVSGKLPV